MKGTFSFIPNWRNMNYNKGISFIVSKVGKDEKDEQNQTYHTVWFQTIFQSYSNYKQYDIGIKIDT